MIKPFDVVIIETPKNFKYSRKKRIRNKQQKKFTVTKYKSCVITNILEGVKQ